MWQTRGHGVKPHWQGDADCKYPENLVGVVFDTTSAYVTSAHATSAGTESHSAVWDLDDISTVSKFQQAHQMPRQRIESHRRGTGVALQIRKEEGCGAHASDGEESAARPGAGSIHLQHLLEWLISEQYRIVFFALHLGSYVGSRACKTNTYELPWSTCKLPWSGLGKTDAGDLPWSTRGLPWSDAEKTDARQLPWSTCRLP